MARAGEGRRESWRDWGHGCWGCGPAGEGAAWGDCVLVRPASGLPGPARGEGAAALPQSAPVVPPRAVSPVPRPVGWDKSAGAGKHAVTDTLTVSNTVA